MATETLRPNGPGSETAIDTQFPAGGEHWDKVKETPPDDDATYVENKNGPVGTWQRDLYAIPNSSIGSGTINSVTVYMRSKHNAPTADAPTIQIKTHTTVYDGAHGTGDPWNTVSTEWTTNPYTGNPWTWDEIDDLEIGVKCGGSTYSPDWVRCTQLYVVVTYGLSVPTVSTDPATAVGRTTATLNGTLDDDGEEACDVRFQYGETIAYGINTAWQLGKESVVAFAQAITGLSPNTTYHFRAQARNSAGTVNGDDRTFTTNPALAINRAYALAREEL